MRDPLTLVVALSAREIGTIVAGGEVTIDALPGGALRVVVRGKGGGGMPPPALPPDPEPVPMPARPRPHTPAEDAEIERIMEERVEALRHELGYTP